MKRRQFFFTLLLLLAALEALPQPGRCAAGIEAEEEPGKMIWTHLSEGLDLGLAVLPESLNTGSGAVFVALRISVRSHTFKLGMASELGEALSLAEWSLRADLRAGINASMYLPDRLTSTGYLRSGESVNNRRLGERLGAFFVAEPKDDKAPGADIIERGEPRWRERLEEYSLVAQNFRLISRGELLWPPGRVLRSIAVVAKDSEGRILFLLCQEPLTIGQFAMRLDGLGLGLGTVMYVEGGVEAGLFVRLDNKGPDLPGASAHSAPGGTIHVWRGRQSLLNTKGSPDATLPNILGLAMQNSGQGASE